MKRRLKARKAYAGSHWLHRLVRWFRDVRDIRECKNILWGELDRDRDETESLRSLTVVTVNALHREREINDIPQIPDYLKAAPLASAIARGLSHEEHKAEWEAKHGPIDSANIQDLPPATTTETDQ